MFNLDGTHMTNPNFEGANKAIINYRHITAYLSTTVNIHIPLHHLHLLGRHHFPSKVRVISSHKLRQDKGSLFEPLHIPLRIIHHPRLEVAHPLNRHSNLEHT